MNTLRNKKRLIKLISLILLMTALSGCSGISMGEEPTDDDGSKEIELIEPVGTVMRYEKAEYRELSRVSTYQGVVCPDTVEYSYESDQPFGNYVALPGDPVKTGDILFNGNTDGYDDQIDDIEEENATLLDDYANYMADYSIDLAKAKKSEFEAASAYMSMKNNEPSEDAPYYAGWAKGVMPLENRYKQAKEAREKMEQSFVERQQLFDLEYSYNEKRISRINEKKDRAGVKSTKDGVVVAANYYLSGDQVPQGSNIIAVGDPSDKEIICEYVSKSIINKAAAVYAVIDGKRYDVQYVNMEPEEYRRLKKLNDDVYTTFKIAADTDEISLGQYAVIVVLEKKIENVLCVPKDAVNKDDTGFFVYKYEDGDSVYTPVQTGESDSGFIEITSGLTEGDKVVYDAPYNIGTKTTTVKKGDVGSEFNQAGYLMYPAAYWVENPGKNGTSYLTEILVSDYEQVTEGQTVAKVEIVSDTIEIERIQRKIQRQTERIADLYEKRATTYNKDELESIDRSIKDRNRTIESLNKQLNKLAGYTGVVELKAPCDGIVVQRTKLKAGEIIGYKEKLVQIASDDSSYIALDDKGGLLSYGQKAVVTVKDQTGKATELDGEVVSLNPYGLTKNMRTGMALVKVNPEQLNAITGSGSGMNNGFWYRLRLNVSIPTKSMKDVLLIPQSAAYKTGNDTYVRVKDEEGMTKLVRFIAGGSSNGNYWVAYGDITEGMEICLE